MNNHVYALLFGTTELVVKRVGQFILAPSIMLQISQRLVIEA